MFPINVRVVLNVPGISAHPHSCPGGRESIFVEFYNNGNPRAPNFPTPLVLVPEGVTDVPKIESDPKQYQIPADFAEIQIEINESCESDALLVAVITVDPNTPTNLIVLHILCALQ